MKKLYHIDKSSISTDGMVDLVALIESRVLIGPCGFLMVKLQRTQCKLKFLMEKQFIVTSTSIEHYVCCIVLFVYSMRCERYTLYIYPSPQVFSQWRWKLFICASGVHPVENNMPRINQEKMCFPILGWMLLPLSGFPTNWAICTGNAIIAAIGKDCATTTMSGLFFSCNHFLKWLGKQAVNEWGGTWIVLLSTHVKFQWPQRWCRQHFLRNC